MKSEEKGWNTPPRTNQILWWNFHEVHHCNMHRKLNGSSATYLLYTFSVASYTAHYSEACTIYQREHLRGNFVWHIQHTHVCKCLYVALKLKIQCNLVSVVDIKIEFDIFFLFLCFHRFCRCYCCRDVLSHVVMWHINCFYIIPSG